MAQVVIKLARSYTMMSGFLPQARAVGIATTRCLHTSSVSAADKQDTSDTAETNEQKSGTDSMTDEDWEAELKRRTNPATGEVDGPRGPEPTRYGDWEKGGRCYDF